MAIGEVTKNSDFRLSEEVLVLRPIDWISSRLPADLVNFLELCAAFFVRFELNIPNLFAKFCIEPFEEEKSELMPDVDPWK